MTTPNTTTGKATAFHRLIEQLKSNGTVACGRGFIDQLKSEHTALLACAKALQSAAFYLNRGEAIQSPSVVMSQINRALAQLAAVKENE